MSILLGSDRADLNIFTKNKVRQGESEGWITELGPRPRLYSYRASKTKLGKVSKEGRKEGINPIRPIINSYVRARPPCRSCVSNDNSKCRESQKLIDSSRSVTNPNPCSRQKYAIFGQATDVDGGGGLLRDFGESEIMGDQAGAAINERARERERRTHHVRPSDTH